VTVSQSARPSRLLRLAEVEARTGLKKSTLYSLMAIGDLPPSVRLSARAVAWRESEIETFILERVRSNVPPLPAQISNNLGRVVQGGAR
jgi:prophage regulatory protein